MIAQVKIIRDGRGIKKPEFFNHTKHLNGFHIKRYKIQSRRKLESG